MTEEFVSRGEIDDLWNRVNSVEQLTSEIDEFRSENITQIQGLLGNLSPENLAEKSEIFIDLVSDETSTTEDQTAWLNDNTSGYLEMIYLRTQGFQYLNQLSTNQVIEIIDYFNPEDYDSDPEAAERILNKLRYLRQVAEDNNAKFETKKLTITSFGSYFSSISDQLETE